MAASAKNPLLTNDDLTLNLLVKDAMRDEDVAYVIFADQDEKILAHGDVSLVGTALERPKELKPAGNDLLVQTYTDPKEGTLSILPFLWNSAKYLLGRFIWDSVRSRSSEPSPQRETKLFSSPV